MERCTQCWSTHIFHVFKVKHKVGPLPKHHTMKMYSVFTKRNAMEMYERVEV